MPDLDLVRRNLTFTLGELLVFLATPRRIEVEAAAVQRLCDAHRRIGICRLLGDADAPGFFQALGHSANAYLSVLSRVKWEDVGSPYYLCTSRAAPFFDALAGANVPVAQAIAARARNEWSEDDEYEDDYAWVRAVMALLGDGKAPAPDAAACIDRLEETAGEDDPRTELCRALLDGESPAFGAALRTLAEAHATAMQELRKDGGADPNEVATEGRLFVQGAALARLGLQRGLTIERQPELVPEASYRKPFTDFPAPDAWRKGPG